MPIIISSLLIVILIVVSILDLKTKKIPNYWSLVNLILALISHFIFSNYHSLSWSYFLIPLGFLLFGFILFALKIAGGGDVKFLFTFLYMLKGDYQLEFLYCLALTTVVVALTAILTRLVRRYTELIIALKTKTFRIVDFVGGKLIFSPVYLVAFIWWLLQRGHIHF